jgi:hypothetical protein
MAVRQWCGRPRKNLADAGFLPIIPVKLAGKSEIGTHTRSATSIEAAVSSGLKKATTWSRNAGRLRPVAGKRVGEEERKC